MSRIVVRPELLEGLGSQLHQASGELEAMERRLWSVMRALDWEARQKAGVDGQVAAAGTRMGALASEAETMSRYLVKKARDFVAADRAGADGLGSTEVRFKEVLHDALLGARRTWWQARLSGDQETMDAVRHQADRLRFIGASASEEATRSVDQEFEPRWERVQSGQLRFDGTAPAPGTTDTDFWRPIDAPVTSDPSTRSPALYDQVIEQFAVSVNPRYARRDVTGDSDAETFCNIFVWDVTRAMGVEVADRSGADGVSRALNANGMAQWLADHGSGHGWRAVSAEEAQAQANGGRPVVAAWHSGSGGPGHVAMVRPGEYDPVQGPAIAQAGAQNVSRSTVREGFGQSRIARVKYWVHD